MSNPSSDGLKQPSSKQRHPREKENPVHQSHAASPSSSHSSLIPASEVSHSLTIDKTVCTDITIQYESRSSLHDIPTDSADTQVPSIPTDNDTPSVPTDSVSSDIPTGANFNESTFSFSYDLPFRNRAVQTDLDGDTWIHTRNGLIDKERVKKQRY